MSYADAVAEAHVQSLQRNKNAFIMGVGVADATGIFGTTKAAAQKFGTERVFNTPMAENTLTGACVGAACMGMHPVIVHARNDFLLLTLDQIVNHAAKWRYMSDGKLNIPMLVRAVIGRGWGQAAQHSQSLQATFMHFPGLQVIMPSNAYDAKGLILAAMESDTPTICLEHRWLHGMKGEVPADHYVVPIGKGKIVRKGKDATIVAISHMVVEAVKAAETLAKEGIEVEIVDPRTLRPLDEKMILSSVTKTGRCIVADTAGSVCGASAEISALVSEKVFSSLKAPIVRVTPQDTPTPCSFPLEMAYYPNAETIENIARTMVKGKEVRHTVEHKKGTIAKPFSGAF